MICRSRPQSVWLISRHANTGDVELARQRIAYFVKRTPLVRNHVLSDRLGTNISLKLEMFQRTCSFKVRLRVRSSFSDTRRLLGQVPDKPILTVYQ
jgi:hypothetical protein